MAVLFVSFQPKIGHTKDLGATVVRVRNVIEKASIHEINAQVVIWRALVDNDPPHTTIVDAIKQLTLCFSEPLLVQHFLLSTILSMNQDETNCQEEISNPEAADDGSDAEQPKLLPVLEWAERKKTERWLLCLAAVAAEWQPEQEAECVDRIPEAAFDAAIEQAIAAHERAKGEAGGARKAKVLVHNNRLIGVIVRKLPPTEMTALFDGLENKNGKEATSYLRSRFTSRILWPSLSVWSAIRDDLPGAESAMINHWVASMGTEAAEPTKKR